MKDYEVSSPEMGKRISKPRAWAFVTVVLVACIVAIGLGLGLGLQKKEGERVIDRECPVQKAPSSSRLTEDSPVYVQPTNIKEGFYRFATVASDARICSSYGTEMMARHGGSAVDAAIAAILCNGVYNPQSCGIGGGFFMTYYKRSERKGYAIMSREMAPGAATEDMFTNGTSSTEGGMAVAIPGEIKGLYEAWKLGGKLPWSALFRPAIQMCREGFPVGTFLASDINNQVKEINRNPELKSMLTNNATGELYKKGEIIKLPKLARTFELIAEDPFAFYNGSLARNISLDIADGGGIITLDDLKSYRAAVKQPLMLNMTGGYTALSPPPPSSGSVVLLILNILSGFNMSADSLSTGDRAVETFHRIAEAFKHGFSVRTNLGDVDQEDQKFKDELQELLDNMTSLSWGERKRAKITNITHDTAYYEPTYDFVLPDAGTTHISVLGAEGDAVSITSTINLIFGSKLVGSRTGIVFNNEMDDFSTPNTTNFFKVPASPANFIKPFKRPLSSMSPTIVLDADGDVKLVTGATGGTRIITSTALSVIHTLMLDLGLKEAVEYPRIHHQLLPPELRIEKAMPKVIMDGLKKRGHVLDVGDKLLSSIQAILLRNKQQYNVQNVLSRKETGIFAFSDPIREGAPDGV